MAVGSIGALFAVPQISLGVGTSDTVAFQARILSKDRLNAPSGSFSFRFSLYNTASDGSALWTEQWTAGNQLAVRHGVFAVNLGSISAIDSSLFTNTDLYLTVEFDSDSNGSFDQLFLSRIPVTAVPYALSAKTINGTTVDQLAPTDSTYITLSNSSSLSNERVLAGTTDQITITDGGANGALSLSLPQSIATTSSVQFGSLNLGGALNVTGATTLATSLTGLLKATSGVVSTATADVDYQRVVTWGDGLGYSGGTASVDYNTTNLQVTASQLNTIQNIATASSPTFASLNLSSTSNQLVLQSGGVTGTLTWTPTSVNKSITIPDADGTVAVSASSPLALSAAGALTIQNAAADGSTKGAASFAAADFDATTGNISLDYTNGTAATSGAKGFLTAADWTTFNSKQAAGSYITALTGDVTASGPGSVAATIADGAVTLAKMANMATASFIGRNTALDGVPEVLSATTAKSILAIAQADVSGLTTASSPTFAGLALGAGDITMTGSLGLTGSRLTKGWFTDLEVTNAIAGSVTGNAATVTTNANLTGPITSTGNTTAVASQTGTGSTFVMATSPTLVTPALGEATYTTLSGGNITDSALTATRVTYAGTAGILQDSANMTFDTTNGLKLAAGSASALQLTSTAGTAVGGLLFGTDTNLYRSAADTLKTDDTLRVGGSMALEGATSRLTIGGTTINTNTVLYVNGTNVTADDNATAASFTTNANPTSGTLATLRSLDLYVGSEQNKTITTTQLLHINEPITDTGVSYGTVYGAYIDAIDLGTTANVGLYIADAGTYSLQLASTDGDAASGITFGTDTTLYRSAANTLKTDDTFYAPNLVVNAAVGNNGIISFVEDGTEQAQIYYNPVYDNLQLATGTPVVSRIIIGLDGNVGIGTQGGTYDPDVLLHLDSTGYIGWDDGAGTVDTNLYRSAANTLKTDDALIVVSRAAFNTTATDADWELFVQGDIRSNDGTIRADNGLTVAANSADLLAQADLRYYDSDSTNYVGFQAPATIGSDVVWTLPNADGGAGQCLSTNAGVLSWADCGGGSGAPTTSQYVALALDGTLSAERILTGTANQITITDNGANGTVVLSTPQDIATASSPQFAGLTLTGSAALNGGLTVDTDNFTVSGTTGAATILGAMTTGTGLDISFDVGTQTGVFTALDVDLSNITPDGTNAVYGLHLQDAVSNTDSIEYGLYQSGTNWDYGAYFDDLVRIADSGLVLGSTAVTSTAAELNILDGATLTLTELNYLDGTTVTAGGVIFGNGSYLANTGVGNSGELLTSAGAGTPTWTAQSSINAGQLDTLDSADFLRATASDTYEGSNDRTLTIQSALTAAARTANLVTISQANDVTYNQTAGVLLNVAQADTGSSTNAVYIQNAGTGYALAFEQGTTSADGIVWGADANLVTLYRSAADTLKTDDALIVGSSLNVTSTTTLDTSLTGLLKAASGVVSAAAAGTDYVAPGGTLFTLAGSTGDNQTISQGNTLTIAAGTDITTTGGATDTVTIANSSTLSTVTGRGATTTTLVNLDGGIAVDTSNFTVNGTSGAISTASTISAGGTVTIQNTAPQLTLTDTDDSNSARLARSDSSGTLALYNTVNTPGTGYAGQLTGASNQYYDAGNPAALQLTTAISIEAWIYPTALPFEILSKNGNSGVRFLIEDVDGTQTLRFFGNYAGGIIVNGAEVTANAWHHVAVTANASGVNLYLDGNNVGSSGSSYNGTGMGTGNLQIGAVTAYATYATGKIDNLAFYNQAIDPSVITDHYNSGAGKIIPTDTTGLVAYWPFDENTGTDAVDIKNSITATGQNTPTWGSGLAPGSGSDSEITVLTATDGIADGEAGIISLGNSSSTLNLAGGSIVAAAGGNTVLTVADPTTAASAAGITAVNSASGSLNALNLSGTLGIFNGSDTFRGIYLNYTNANHTSTGNSFYGLDIAGITADADATEHAININSGWDVGMYIADGATYSLQLASTDGDAASGITFGTDTNLYRGAASELTTDDLLAFSSSKAADAVDFKSYKPDSTGAQFLFNTSAAVSTASLFAVQNNTQTKFAITATGTIMSAQAYSDTVGVTNRDLFIDDTGKIGYVSSSARYKQNISDLNSTEWLYNLRPVTFEYTTDPTHTMQIGLVAEEVEQTIKDIYPSLVSYKSDDPTVVETVNYSQLIVPLLAQTQLLHTRLEQNELAVANLQSTLSSLISDEQLRVNTIVSTNSDLVLRPSTGYNVRVEGNLSVDHEISGASLKLNDDVAGRTVLPAGSSSVFVPTSAISEQDTVLITPILPSNNVPTTSFTLYRGAVTEGQGFWVTVVPTTTLNYSLEFDWLIVH